MPNDAKLGLVTGVGVVIFLAVFFFQATTPPSTKGGETASSLHSGPPKNRPIPLPPVP